MPSNNKIINICDNSDSAINDDNTPPISLKKVTFDMTDVNWDSTQYTFDNNN